MVIIYFNYSRNFLDFSKLVIVMGLVYLIVIHFCKPENLETWTPPPFFAFRLRSANPIQIVLTCQCSFFVGLLFLTHVRSFKNNRQQLICDINTKIYTYSSPVSKFVSSDILNAKALGSITTKISVSLLSNFQLLPSSILYCFSLKHNIILFLRKEFEVIVKQSEWAKEGKERQRPFYAVEQLKCP